MSVYSILEDVAEEQGWSEFTQLQLVMEYISNQQDDSAFADFLRQQADEENWEAK